MSKFLKIAAALFVVPLVAGCATVIEVDGHEVLEENYEDDMKSVLTRASFETDCPEQDLETKILDADGRILRQVGVNGCDFRLVYIRPFGGEWTLNSVSNGNEVRAPENMD